MTFLKLRILFFLTCFCFREYLCQGSSDDVDVRMFLDDNQWTTNAPRSTPVTLGSFPYECIGNIDLCIKGFTLSLWYNPGPGDSTVPHLYILSTGGQSAISDGIYIRQNYGQEFEVGVGSDAIQWTVKFNLVSGSWTNLGLTWSSTSGLAVYVDGLSVGEDAAGTSRVYWKSQYNPFQNLVIGGANDNVAVAAGGKGMLVWRIIYADLMYTADQMRHFVANVTQSLVVACSSSPPGFVSSASGVRSLTDPTTLTDLNVCQDQCATNQFNLVLFQLGKQCICVDRGFYSTWLAGNGKWGSTSCTGTEGYLLEWATHVVWQAAYPINLTVAVFNLTAKPYIRPNETVIFTVKESTNEQVTFYFDFNDGETLVTTDQVVGYAWLKEGTYEVNVTAATRTTTETVVTEVVVAFVAEGVAPQVLLVKADPTPSLVSFGMVDVLVSAYSPQSKTCTLAYGDDGTKVFPASSDFIFDGQDQHSYDEIGYYNVSLLCSNDFGSSAASTMAVSVNPNLLYANVARLDGISIQFIGPGDVQVVADGIGAQSGVSVTSQAISIRDDIVLSASGEHSVKLKSTASGIILQKQIYNINTRIALLTVTSNVSATRVNQNITFTIVVAKGDGLHLNASFGDGTWTLLYAPASSTPLTITQTHSYSTLGKFDFTVTVTNDVSEALDKETVSIERPIERAAMNGSNVTSIDQSTTFTLEVDMDKSPAMPVSVVFNYDDGNTETVLLGSQTPVAGQLTHSYRYGKYGIYRVSAVVKNNISSVALPIVIVQVGENITLLDIYVQNSIVAVSQDVVFTVKCPTGSPVVLEMNMGDGSPVVVQNRPTTYSAKTDNKVYQQPQKSSGVNNVAGKTKTKRQATTAASTSNDFIVIYQYKSAGSFTVRAKVSNALTNTSSSLCPTITVVSPSLPTPSCSQSSVAISNPTPLDSPQVVNRSETVVLATSTSMVCSGGGLTFASAYTWTTERLMADGTWRPELQLCASNMRSPSLTVSGNTLWYGIYRLNVTMVVGSLSGSTLSPTLTRSMPASTYLRVDPTPLVASIANTDENYFTTSSVVSINMNGSSDPDVSPVNRTGLSLFLFCYTSQTSTKYASMTLSQMLNSATSVGNNSEGNVHVYQFNPDPCFQALDKIWAFDLEVTINAGLITLGGPVNFVLFVTKDERVASTVYQIQVMSTNVSASELDNIDAMLRSGNTNAALMVINLVADGMGGSGSDGGEDAVAGRTELRGKLINCLDKVSDNLQNLDQLGVTTQVMASVTSNPDEVTDEARANASNALGKSAAKAMDLAQSASSDKVANITGSMLASVGNILPFPADVATNGTNGTSTGGGTQRRRRRSILSALKKTKTSSTTNETAENSTVCCDALADLCDWIEPVGGCVDERHRKKTIWTEADCELIHPDDIALVMARFIQWHNEQVAAQNAVKKAITTNGMGACNSIGGVLLSKQGDGANVSVSSPKMNITVTNINPSQAARRKKRDAGGSATGAQSSDYELPVVPDSCGAMSMQSQNPFTYSAQGNQVNGNVKTLSLTNCDGSPVEVRDSPEPIVLWMDGASEEPQLKQFSITAATAPNGTNYHRIEITDNNTAILAIVRPLNPDHVYAVFLKYGGFPNETYNDWEGEVPRAIGPDDSEDMRYSVYPPQNVTSLNGTYRFGLRLKAAPGDGVASGGSKWSSANSTYAIYMYATACRFWNDTIDAWDTSGCSVGEQTTPMKTQCLCNHLTSFGGSFAVPPNTIDFNTVFTAAKFLESIPVFTTVVALIAVYLLILVWARHMDKNDIARWGALPLEDNLPSDSYYYQLSVYTGIRSNAGTASKPSFVLSGDLSDSGIRHLADGKRKTIPAGSIHNYVLSVESNLGPLTFLRIWHDNAGTGKKKGWYLDQIQVTDLQTGERFFFVCDRWLAVEEDDGLIERIIPVAGMDDLTQFKQLFSHSVRKKFSNDHMWFSVFSRPTRSGFTRVQRISCCVALLFLTMITNCMFFKATDPDHTTSVHIGPLEFTIQQIYISVVCTLIVLPPSVAIITIFKKAKPKPNAIQQENQSDGKKRKGWRSIDAGSALWNNERQSRMQKFRDTVRNIALFHQKTKYEEEEGQEGGGLATGGAKKKKKPVQFPWWTIFIAWALVFLSVALSGFFTILYSMQWGHQKSIDWLTTFFLSFFQSVVVVQPIKVLAFAAFLSCILKKPDVEDEEGDQDLNAMKPDEEYVNNSHLDLQEIVRMRQRSRMETSLPDMDVLKRSRENRLKEMEIEAILKECMIYIFFILVLYFIAYQDKDKRSFLFSQNLQTRFFNGNPTFAKIQSYSDVYTWLNKTLIPQLYTTAWYNGQTPKNWQEVLEIDDHMTIRLGVARLRQLRIKDNTCKVQSAFRNLIDHCRSDYNWMDDDTKSYGVNWTPMKKNLTSGPCSQYADKNDPWAYRDSIELKGSPYMGLVNSYKGGGYTFNFYRDLDTTLEKLKELESQNWLDVHTRGLFVEFTLYNANVNLYGSVIMLLEFLSNGGPVRTNEVKVFRLTSYVGPFGIIVILFQVIYVCFIIYFLVHISKLLKKQKLKYFKDFWNLLEFVTMVMSIVTVAMYGMKMIFGNTAMDVLKASGSGKFVNFVTIGVWNETYGFILAVVVFLSTIKFINMLKFNRRLSMLTETIKAASKDLKAFIITFFIYFFAFSQLGYLLFCTQIPTYSTFTNTIEVLFCLILGQPGFSDMQTAQAILGPVFYFLYTWFVVFGMQSMFLCIICEAFQVVRKELEFQRNDYEVGDFIIGKIKGLFGLK